MEMHTVQSEMCIRDSTRGDILSLARAANLYYPNTLKNSVNEKGNDVYKLDQMLSLIHI